MRTIFLKAEKKWRRIPEADRNCIIENVFCIHCGVCSLAPNYSIEDLPSGDILLHGTCSSCGEDVARVVEKGWWE